MDDVRTTLDRLIRDNGDDYASLSRLLGRNAAYIQQFLRRGTPRKLDEDDRRTLAKHFGIDETVLGGPKGPIVAGVRNRRGADFLRIPRIAVQASAGSGALDAVEVEGEDFVMDAQSVRALGDPAQLSMIRVMGDSMMPTLGDGDDIVVDRADGPDRLRDGIYVLRFDDALNVKRIAMNPQGGHFSVISDNTTYPSWPDCDPARVAIIGRVVWAGRRVS
jgi:Peptidase S24-like